jgi:hypothetical protein
MPRYVFVVMTAPVEGREDEYNDWYTNRHLDEVLEVEGIVAAQRFKLCEVPGIEGAKPYCAFYEIEAPSAAVAHKALTDKAQSGTMFVSDALSREGIYTGYYEAISERKVAKA